VEFSGKREKIVNHLHYQRILQKRKKERKREKKGRQGGRE
jgi:hypothetical protein